VGYDTIASSNKPVSVAMSRLSLYIHIPWCIQKCPYCDFNSHKSPKQLPEKDYILALLADLDADLLQFAAYPLQSIFIGGGTPSLFSAESLHLLFTELKKRFTFEIDIEITLEANPGTVEQQRFTDYRQLGINRLSLGIQSFNPQHLKTLGRIHDDRQAHQAIEAARYAGFPNLNLDIMHGLPKQSLEEGLLDLTTAIHYQVEHISWYQLTIEPNTLFYKQRPTLPTEDEAFVLEEQGLLHLAEAGFTRYEISAFAKPHKQSQHNLNYWLFGDYFGIGAGAHGKHTKNGKLYRTAKHRQPITYLQPDKPHLASLEPVVEADIVFEFMLNTTRLEAPIALSLFEETTRLNLASLLPKLQLAAAKKLVHLTDDFWQVTPLGRRYTNDLQAMFLP
jgi:putative oxygen-independent coproporphyrinogen III oxidase